MSLSTYGLLPPSALRDSGLPPSFPSVRNFLCLPQPRTIPVHHLRYPVSMFFLSIAFFCFSLLHFQATWSFYSFLTCSTECFFYVSYRPWVFLTISHVFCLPMICFWVSIGPSILLILSASSPAHTGSLIVAQPQTSSLPFCILFILFSLVLQFLVLRFSEFHYHTTCCTTNYYAWPNNHILYSLVIWLK